MPAHSEPLVVIPWTEEFAAPALALLRKFEETSLFLLSNLASFGPHVTEAASSGTFQLILRG